MRTFTLFLLSLVVLVFTPSDVLAKDNDAPIQVAPMLDYCGACEFIVNQIEDKGCSLACGALPPPADALCDLILGGLGLCETIISWLHRGFNSQAVCDAIGFCGSGECRCGKCTPYVVGRCLSVPNHCGQVVQSPFDDEPVPRTNNVLQERICVDHTCDSSHYGCCLTCF